MDECLVFEAWLNSWSHAFLVHRTGKGQTCNLQKLSLEVPTKNHDSLFQQRALVENAQFLGAAMASEIWSIPCKKNVCKAAHTGKDLSKMARFWITFVLTAFSKTTTPAYIVQSREDWTAAMALNIEAISLFADLPKKHLKQCQICPANLISNCVSILEYEVYRPSDYDCSKLLTAVSHLADLACVSETVLKTLSRIVVSLSSQSNFMAAFLAEGAVKHEMQSMLAQDLFELWRSHGVTGTACAEKLIQFLGSSKTCTRVILYTLRQLAITGNAPALARTQPVMDYLKLIAANEFGVYDERLNATLLMIELFPRHAWEVVNTIIPHLREPNHFCPLVIAAFSLHDVPMLLSLLPETNVLVCEDESCLKITASKASECALAEIKSILKLAEKHLADGEAVSLSWIALVLAISVGSVSNLSEVSLLAITRILKGQDVNVIKNLIRYWAVAVARHYNITLRDIEIDLPVMHVGFEIQYPPSPDNQLFQVVTECCNRWLERAPRVIRALQARISMECSPTVFAETTLSPSDVRPALSVSNQWYQQEINHITHFCSFIKSFDAWFQSDNISVFNDDDISTCNQSMKKLHSSWNYVMHNQNSEQCSKIDDSRPHVERVTDHSLEIFEKHVDLVVSSYSIALTKLGSLLDHLGHQLECELDMAASIYNSAEQCAQLQRFLEMSIRICTECVYRPLHSHKSLLNYLWFDRQLCPLIQVTRYLFKASLWFYADPQSPLTFKLRLAQLYAQYIQYPPKAFKSARLPMIPIEGLISLIKSTHTRVVKQLQMRDVISTTDVNDDEDGMNDLRVAEEQNYQRDIADFIVTAIC